ncbi:MAG TPA: hypothetical protein GX700_11205, partial [Paracoccus sp.]|nr:hypothetical protein [Paracoccus sp. (in: a-proteobacteria)]
NQSGGRAAGRVIRLQTAPERSIFPVANPRAPSMQPSEQLLANISSDISAVLAEVAAPEPQVVVDSAESPAAPASDETLIAAAPARSPVPLARPEDEALLAEADSIEEDLIVARAVGFSTIDPQEYLALTEGSADAAADVITTTALVSNLSEPPAEAPADQTAETAGTGAEIPATDPAIEAAIVNAIAESLLTATAMPVLPPTEELMADVVVEDGLVVIPGLPPIAVETSALLDADAPLQPIFASVTASPAEETTGEATPETTAQATPEATVQAIGETAEQTANTRVAALDGRIVLTASDADLPGDTTASPPPAPEIVTRVSTSGGQIWAVDLGLYPSRFDAERAMLRLALSENGTLGGGVRRVGQRSGRFVAGIHSLTQDQAELACLRLNARAQSCEVIHP